jgi:alkanesulfonate monooxygenase SsuD/methylene tetrahydromethanopterin reductase-like flavin-dependent oxidoreductase (luciferase family)
VNQGPNNPAGGGDEPPQDENKLIAERRAKLAEWREQAKAAYELYVDTRLYARKHSYEDILANGICLFGSVETVAGKVRRLREMGIRHVATLHNFGALAPALVQQSMTLFAREVIPGVSAASTRASTSGSAR